MQIQTNQNKKEMKEHGNYEFPVKICEESILAYEQGMFLWHWHPEIELTWIRSGEIEYHVNDTIHILKAGEGIFGNCNTLHAGFQRNGQECEYLSVTFHPRFLYGYEGSILQTKYVSFITENDRWPALKLDPGVSWQKQVLGHIRKIYQISKEEPQDFELQVHLLLSEIWQQFYLYFQALPDQGTKSPRQIQRLQKLLSYLQEHSAEELSLDGIANQVNLCKSECCRFFKRYMHMTIFDYLLFLRVQNSLVLLKAGEGITETAEAVGFSNAAYYGQIFKRYMKCTPSQYRARHREE